MGRNLGSFAHCHSSGFGTVPGTQGVNGSGTARTVHWSGHFMLFSGWICVGKDLVAAKSQFQ